MIGDPGSEIIVHPEPAKRCHARSKQSGEQCRKPVRPGYPVCDMHGAGRGDRHPGDANLKHGRRSKFVSLDLRRLQEAYLENEAPEDMTHELALLRALVQRFLERLQEEEELADEEADPVLSDLQVIAGVTRLIETIGQTVSRMDRIRQNDAVPRQEVVRLVGEIYNVLQQTITDPAQLDTVVSALRGIRVVKSGKRGN